MTIILAFLWILIVVLLALAIFAIMGGNRR